MPEGHPADSGCYEDARQCRATTLITQTDRAMLEKDLDDAVHQAETDHRCQYQAGHKGPHVCLAQSQDRPDGTSTAWCVTWPTPNDTVYRLAVLPECPALAAHLNDDSLCLNPEGHPATTSGEPHPLPDTRTGRPKDRSENGRSAEEHCG